MLSLGQHVEWGNEESCFRGLAQASAACSSVQPLLLACTTNALCLLRSGCAVAAKQHGQWIVINGPVLQALAELYRLQPSIADAAAEAEAEAEAAGGGPSGEQQAAARDEAQQRRRQREWTVQHVLLPALR